MVRDSRATTIEINADDSLVAAANHDVGTVSIFSTATNTVVSRPGPFPGVSAVAFSPSGNTLWVLHQGGLSRVTGVDTVNPTVGAAVPMCGEPRGMALSPSGGRIFVACLEGKVLLVDTAGGTATISSTVNLRGAAAASGGNLPQNAAAMAIAVSNNLNQVDADERVVVPLFFYDPIDTDLANADLGGQGVVAILDFNGSILQRVNVAPDPDAGFGVGAFMNQLNHVWLQNGQAFITAMAASPRGAPGPAAADADGNPAGSKNVFPYLIIVDVATGNVLQTHSLNKLNQLKADNGSPNPIRYGSVPSAMAFVPGTGIGYLTSISSDASYRIRVNADGSLFGTNPEDGLGSAVNNFIALGQAPSGITISHGTGTIGTRGFVVTELNRKIQVINFADQAVSATVDSETLPTAGSPEERRRLGKRFFYTSIARWGNNGLTGCLSCHPGGNMTDNVTWQFPAGPRQTVALDGTWGKQNGVKVKSEQRALNWTAVRDEVHDFELNTRNISGGVGAVVSDSGLDNANRINLAAAGPGGAPAVNLRNSVKTIVTADSALKDWDEIEEWLLAIKTPRNPAPTAAEQTQIDRGRAVFNDCACQKCHGTNSWTVSRLPYDPTDNTGGTLASERAFTTAYTGQAPFNTETTVVAGDDVAGQSVRRVACVLREVGTFSQANEHEVRVGGTTQAQGVRGYNPPSLLGARYGAPYLHRGQAKTLVDLFDPSLDAHTTAGNPNCLANNTTRAADVSDLTAFLESIDDTTQEFTTPAGSVYCPTSIP